MPLGSANCADTRLKRDLTLNSPIKRGKSKKARLLQELLRLNGSRIAIDGDFGPITAGAVGDFASQHGDASTNSVNQRLLDLLAQPLLRAVEPVAPLTTIGATVIAVAKRHLKQYPIEVGGPNMGPWVRLYMDGHQGAAWPWCAGFVTYVVRAAAKAHGVNAPVGRTYSCDVLGTKAIHNGTFRKRNTVSKAPPGSIFLVRRTANDWTHTGFVEADDGTTFSTIEGNTNDEGHREGYEACARKRHRAKLDLVIL